MRPTIFWLAATFLGAPAVLLTAARLIDNDNGSLIRMESFTPFAMPLYVVLLVLFVGGAVQRSGGPRVWLVGLSVAAAAGLALHGWWFAPQVTGDNPGPRAGAPTITVMNANLYEGRGDPQDVLDAVRSDHVDILVLEEITPGVLAGLDAGGLTDLLPYRIGTPDRFVAGTMVFSNQRMGEPALLDTQFQSYRVQVGSLTLLAVHPTAPVLPRAWRADHDVIRDEAERSDADLIVGDMNATPDHDVMRELDDAGFRDAGELANEGWQPTWPANHVGVVPVFPPVIRIDHVLVGSSLASLGTRTVDIDGTDHLALVAEVAQR